MPALNSVVADAAAVMKGCGFCANVTTNSRTLEPWPIRWCEATGLSGSSLPSMPSINTLCGVFLVLGGANAFRAPLFTQTRAWTRPSASCVEEFSISREIKNVRVFDGDYSGAAVGEQLSPLKNFFLVAQTKFAKPLRRSGRRPSLKKGHSR